MKKILIVLLSLGFLLGLGSFAAAATVDVLEYGTGHFTDEDNKYNSSDGYYRAYNEDWEWEHSAISGSISSAELSISAWDVDAPSEVDEIYAWDSDAGWVYLGNLIGNDNAWGYTTFDLDETLYEEIASGLKIQIKIDTDTQRSWLVSLAKSVLNVNNGEIPDPTPGSTVPEPGTMVLFGLGLLGFTGLSRRRR